MWEAARRRGCVANCAADCVVDRVVDCAADRIDDRAENCMGGPGRIFAVVLACLLAGLCAPVFANTTAVAISNAGPFAATSAPVHLAQASPPPRAFPQPGTTAIPEAIAQPTVDATAAPAVRIGLMLPLRSSALGAAAQAVLAGFQVSQEREREPGVTVSVIETGDAAAEILAQYNAAIKDFDIIVGPLTRTGVSAIAQQAGATRPTLALAPPEIINGVETPLGGDMLAIGLSVEDEARQVAQGLADRQVAGTAFVVSTSIAWQRRTAKSFATKWREQGRPAEVMEIGVSGGFLAPSGLLQIRKRLDAEKPVVVFVALDAAQARQLRESIGTDIPMVGTSQLNPHSMAGWANAEARTPVMNDVRLIDLPWLLQADHPAVMVYPRMSVPTDSPPPSADLERLYALGIDAYRVAREIALRHPHVELDGVTGRLKMDFGVGASRFERTEIPAVYQDGMVVPAPEAR
jgi:outer membrane PBP1 activator LpoA protein